MARGLLPHVGCYVPRHTIASSYVAKAVTGPGAVATDAEARKRQKYHAIDHAVYKFQPVAIETPGAYGEDSWDFIQQLGRRLCTVTQDTRSASYLLQRLSVAVQRGNADCILGTIADNEGQMDIFAVQLNDSLCMGYSLLFRSF
jgi:hypothetical protein